MYELFLFLHRIFSYMSITAKLSTALLKSIAMFCLLYMAFLFVVSFRLVCSGRGRGAKGQRGRGIEGQRAEEWDRGAEGQGAKGQRQEWGRGAEGRGMG